MAIETFVSKTSELELSQAYCRAARTLRATAKVDARASDQPISPVRESLVSADIRYLSPLLRGLGELRSSAQQADEYGILQAPKHAYDAACHLLIDAALFAALSRRQIPRGCVSSDSEGGVRVQWIRPSKSELLLRPVWHHYSGRTEAHVMICVLAYAL